jgi:hypothetical protein
MRASLCFFSFSHFACSLFTSFRLMAVFKLPSSNCSLFFFFVSREGPVPSSGLYALQELKVRCEVSDYIGGGTDERVELHCYRLCSILLNCGDHDDVQWVSLDEVRSIDVTPVDVSNCQSLRSLLSSFYLFVNISIVLCLSFCQHLCQGIFLLSCPKKRYVPRSFYLFP